MVSPVWSQQEAEHEGPATLDLTSFQCARPMDLADAEDEQLDVAIQELK